MNLRFKIFETTKCRICGSEELSEVLNLGNLAITGYFPKDLNEEIPTHPLTLIKCLETKPENCGLVQLKYHIDPYLLYGNHYGYRSGLNNSMITHLKRMFELCENHVQLNPGDVVVDIAGNDGTFLKNFPANLRLISIDPTSEKFKYFYPNYIEYVSDFFSKDLLAKIGVSNVKLFTSFSVLYDLDNPLKFVQDIAKSLHKDGLWIFEQSYLLSMLQANSFDTICHEHLLYLGYRQIKILLEKAGLQINDVELTHTNGGSILVVASHQNSKYEVNNERIRSIELMDKELSQTNIWLNFKNNINRLRNEIQSLLVKELKSGNKVYGLGASTKGGVLLQYFGITSEILSGIGDVNPDKFKCFVAGTDIPIDDERIILELGDTFLVLPWHFKQFFRESDKYKSKKLIFPLPELETFSL